MTDSPEVRPDGSEAPATPANPTPANPIPVNPLPVNPAPVNPAPINQAPVNPAPANPSAANPTPATPASAPPAYGEPSAPPAYGERTAPAAYAQPAPSESASAPLGSASPGAPRAPRGGRPGVAALVAALAIGAIVGGVSGAGVYAAATGGKSDSPSFNTGSGPANITVNDAKNATRVTAVAAAAGPSVVTIQAADSTSTSAGTGSGVILTADGYVVTNTHVVTLDGASASATISVQTADGHLYKAKIVGTDPISDLAVIKMDGGSTRFSPATFADSSKLNVGDVAVAIGAPLGLANTVTDGIVSSLNRSITVASSAPPTATGGEAPNSTDGNGNQGPFDFWQFGNQSPTTASSTIALSVIQTDAAINPGNSGGALLDADGHVIGINVAIASAGSTSGTSAGAGSIGVGFAIPSNLAKRIANEIITDGKGSHGLLGASVADVTAASATIVGASIQEVTAGGAAAAAGLRKGDIITAINGLPVTGKTDLTAQVRALAGKSKASVSYVRGGSSATADVTLGSLS